MRKLGILKTEEQTYKIKMQEEGRRSTSTPRCPIKIYEKDPDGGWEHLETLDGEKPGTDKKSAYTNMKSTSQAWDDAVEAIRFYDETDIVKTKR